MSSIITTASSFLRSTWIGFELSILGKELTLANIQEEPVSVFVRSLSLRYYTILLIVFCNANILMLRDFGPMLLAEQRARQSARQSISSESQQQPDVSNPASAAENAESPSNPDAAPQLTANLANIDTTAASAAVQASPPNPALWYFAAVPIAVMSVTMACGIVVDGRSKIMEQDPDRSISMMDILSATDTSKVLIWSTLLASVSAIVLCVSLKRLCLEGAVEAWVEGIRVSASWLIVS
jgi:Na+/H+ antiporter NhaC